MPNKLVTFCDGVTGLVNKRRATDVAYPDFCKAFDAVSCDILVSRLKRHRYDVDHSVDKELAEWLLSRSCGSGLAV